MGLAQSAPIHRWVASTVALIVLKYAVEKALSIRRAFTRIQDYPGRMALWIQAFGVTAVTLGAAFPRRSMAGYYAAKFSFYEKFGATSFATIRILPAQPYFWFADAEAIKQITADRFTFQKDVAVYELLNFYGKNVVSSAESAWKQHRSVAMSAFNETNIALVWAETLRVANEWFQEIDAVGQSNILNMVKPMKQATLLIIASASFGRRVSWSEDSATLKPPPGCNLTFRSAVITSVENTIFRVLFPRWLYVLLSVIKVPYLSSRAQLTQLAFNDLRVHMLNLVTSACTEIKSGGRPDAGAALLRNLVEANMNQDSDSKKLTEGEMLSNIFAFLLAGHETTAHSVCFAFVLLALYPECQQRIHEEINRVWPADVPLSHLMSNHREYMDKLEYTIAFIREMLRLLPPEPRVGKIVSKDTVLPGTYFTPGSKGILPVATGKFSMAIPAGSFVLIDVWALHMNPLYWGEDVEEFKPERFIDTPSYQWPRHAFLPFSGGARSCIGQRFALTELVGILASSVHRYTIRVPDDLANKPFHVQRDTLLKWHTGLALTPSNPRVKLCRRV